MIFKCEPSNYGKHMIFECEPKINNIATIYIENGPFSFDANNMQSDVFYNKCIQIQNCCIQINNIF